MPTYGYECLECSTQFEIVQKITEDSLTVHDGCGGKLRKLIYPVGISFKGSGFYVNDYAPGGPKKPKPAAADKAEAGSDTASETKSETKPESTSETKSETKTESKPAAVTESKPAAKVEAKTGS